MAEWCFWLIKCTHLNFSSKSVSLQFSFCFSSVFCWDKLSHSSPPPLYLSLSSPFPSFVLFVSFCVFLSAWDCLYAVTACVTQLWQNNCLNYNFKWIFLKDFYNIYVLKSHGRASLPPLPYKKNKNKNFCISLSWSLSCACFVSLFKLYTF